MGELPKRLIAQHFSDLRQPASGTVLTEVFDILELASKAEMGVLQRDFCALMAEWEPAAHHRRIMQWAKRHEAPVLTTNFDELLGQAAECELLTPKHSRFTDFYPWESAVRRPVGN